MTRFHIVAAAIALGMAAAPAAVADEPAGSAILTAASSATAVSGKIRANGQSVTVKPLLQAKGSAPPAYDVTNAVKSYSKTVALPFDTSLDVQAGAATDEAASNGQEGSKVTATASSSIESGSAKLTNPLISGPLVAVSAGKVSSDATFTKSTTASSSGSGTVSLSDVTVDLRVFGFGLITYSGTARPKPNTVLFKSKDGAIIVYLNRQVANLAASGSNALVAASIQVDAIDVHLTDAQALGATFSGDLLIATSFAD
jgi:hypothetical protein